MSRKAGAKRLECVAAIKSRPRPAHGSFLRRIASEPVEKERLPAERFTAFGKRAKRIVGEGRIGIRALRTQAKTHQHRSRQFSAVSGRKAIQRLHQRRFGRYEVQGAGQLAQVPEDRLRLTAETIQPCIVEVGGGEIGIVARQEAIGAVVEAFTIYVHIVCVEHAMHEAGRHPPCREPCRSGDGAG